MASSRIRSATDDVESICLSTRRVTMVWFGTKVKREIRLASLRRILKSNLRRPGKTMGEQYRIRGRMRVSIQSIQVELLRILRFTDPAAGLKLIFDKPKMGSTNNLRKWPQFQQRIAVVVKPFSIMGALICSG